MPRGKTSLVSMHKQLELLRNKALKALEKQIDSYIATGDNPQSAMIAVRVILAKTLPDLKQTELSGKIETKNTNVVEFR